MLTHDRFCFVPTVPAAFRGVLEALFFFHPRQNYLRAGIRASVEEHGIPEIMEQDDRIWIGVRSGTTQCLFAVDRGSDPEALAGVVVYCRPRLDLLSITHLAVNPAFAADAVDGNGGLGLTMIDVVRQIARRMNGVKRLQLPYRVNYYLPV
jgi:hypothetical protein